MYKLWCCLPERVKESWIQAAKIINSYDELAKSIPNKVSLHFLNLFYFIHQAFK